MPKGRVLTSDEREEILKLHEAGTSGREIAKKLTRSKTVILSFLKNPAGYAQIKRSGRKRALSEEEETRLYRAIFDNHALARDNVQKSASQLKIEFGIPLSTRRIQQLLSTWRKRARKDKDLEQVTGIMREFPYDNDVFQDAPSEEANAAVSSLVLDELKTTKDMETALFMASEAVLPSILLEKTALSPDATALSPDNNASSLDHSVVEEGASSTLV